MNENYGLPHVFNSPVDQIWSFENNASVIYFLVPKRVSFYIINYYLFALVLVN